MLIQGRNSHVSFFPEIDKGFSKNFRYYHFFIPFVVWYFLSWQLMDVSLNIEVGLYSSVRSSRGHLSRHFGPG